MRANDRLCYTVPSSAHDRTILTEVGSYVARRCRIEIQPMENWAFLNILRRKWRSGRAFTGKLYKRKCSFEYYV